MSEDVREKSMRLVAIESPYAGDVARNVRYARACVRDCLNRGESPYASHLFFTQEGLLDDAVPEQRMLGIRAGLSWGNAASLVAVYLDLGLSDGMRHGVRRWAARSMQGIEFRSLRSKLVATIDHPFRLAPWEADKHPETIQLLMERAYAQAEAFASLLAEGSKPLDGLF